MTVMDDYLDSPMDSEEVFPCKGCGEILEEGKAFELAGNRWHLDCFRCHTCNTLLDSDANLLLLGDGSLICNNCTYSCSACGNKIEDLAILTGDQAFCATCFRCRNCKRKIENLRYARTSQGIFCMSCHESLMARRRKKSKSTATSGSKSRDKDASPMITDKSLPALPPNAVPLNAFSNDRVDADSDTPTELSPRPRASYQTSDAVQPTSSRTSRSLERASESGIDAAVTLPATSYRNNRNSSIIPGDLSKRDEDGFLISLGLDHSPANSVTPRTTKEAAADVSRKSKERDYFALQKGSVAPEKKSESQASTPHIAFQERARQPSFDFETPPAERPARKLSKRTDRNGQPRGPGQSGLHRTASNGRASVDGFKLQEVPRSRRPGNSRSDSPPELYQETGSNSKSSNRLQRNSDQRPDTPPVLGAQDWTSSARSSQDSRMREAADMRPSSDSITSAPAGTNMKTTARSEVPTSGSRNVNGKTSSGPSSKAAVTTTTDESRSAPLGPPRPELPGHKMSDTYMQPRAPPQPPTGQSVKASSKAGGGGPPSPKASPKLPRWSSGGDFSMDEDMARILGTDEGSSSILRRVSNAVRHGRTNSLESSNNHRIVHNRSVSETTRGTASPRWPQSPIAEDPGREISSNMALPGGTGHEDPALLKRQLKNSEQRVAELERQFGTEKDLKNLNKKLLEKRKTVSVLDSQTEIMIRQLEVLAGYVERAKKTNEPLDARELEDSAIKEFVQKLDRVKQSMAAQIEQLHAERDELLEEKTQAVAERERALLEFEQLSSKNAQLADMNNEMTHQIQERFKQQLHHGHDMKSANNGLGIYSHAKGASSASVNLDAASLQTGSTMVGNTTDLEEPAVLEQGPTVVNIRKGQVKKFNWKKGTSKVAHNFSKGINRAAGAFQQPQQPDQPRNHSLQGLTGDNIGLPYNMTVAQVEAPVSVVAAQQQVNGQIRSNSDNSRQGFGFFGKKTPAAKSTSMGNVALTPAAAEAPSTLFGSDLVERADFERRQIPSVVQRCIEEVELRGMDVEGIYRKTGGNSQVKMIQEGFDKSEDFDISDPGLDITAVTSVLKQYFRKLPNPLLTFDVYERILESNAVQSESDRCVHLRQTINMLPAKHRDCLEFLMFHLARVADRERENLMSPKNLAVVFAPTIMRDHSLEKEMTDMHAKNLAVQFIIENSHIIFGDA